MRQGRAAIGRREAIGRDDQPSGSLGRDRAQPARPVCGRGGRPASRADRRRAHRRDDGTRGRGREPPQCARHGRRSGGRGDRSGRRRFRPARDQPRPGGGPRTRAPRRASSSDRFPPMGVAPSSGLPLASGWGCRSCPACGASRSPMAASGGTARRPTPRSCWRPQRRASSGWADRPTCRGTRLSGISSRRRRNRSSACRWPISRSTRRLSAGPGREPRCSRWPHHRLAAGAATSSRTRGRARRGSSDYLTSRGFV